MKTMTLDELKRKIYEVRFLVSKDEDISADSPIWLRIDELNRHMEDLESIDNPIQPEKPIVKNERPFPMSIVGSTYLATQVIDAIRKHPPKTSDGRVGSVTITGTHGTVLKFDVTFPPLPPDIPALIRAWHAEPTTDTRKALWATLLDRGMPYYHNGSTYAVTLSTEGPCAIEVT